MASPRICFGQQPCGFFPKRFLYSKIATARTLQRKIGGEVIYFYHDSDSDYRETITVLRDRMTGAEARLNFYQENKIQKKYSPLYARRIPAGWKDYIVRQLPRFVDQPLIAMFAANRETNVADFCLTMYHGMGLLDGLTVVRSSSRSFRKQAMDLREGFADVTFQAETVRARWEEGKLSLHRGGGLEIALPDQPMAKWQISPGRDARLAWMQSVIQCTHYVTGEGEREYVKTADFPAVTFVPRDEIERPEEAYTGMNDVQAKSVKRKVQNNNAKRKVL